MDASRSISSIERERRDDRDDEREWVACDERAGYPDDDAG